MKTEVPTMTAGEETNMQTARHRTLGQTDTQTTRRRLELTD